MVPSNYFAVVSLRQVAEMAQEIHKDNQFAAQCREMADEVENALQKYAVKKDDTSGDILAFEVDGLESRSDDNVDKSKQRFL